MYGPGLRINVSHERLSSRIVTSLAPGNQPQTSPFSLIDKQLDITIGVLFEIPIAAFRVGCRVMRRPADVERYSVEAVGFNLLEDVSPKGRISGDAPGMEFSGEDEDSLTEYG